MRTGRGHFLGCVPSERGPAVGMISEEKETSPGDLGHVGSSGLDTEPLIFSRLSMNY